MLHDLKFDGSSLHCDDPCKTANLAVAAVDVGVAAVAASCLSMDSQPLASDRAMASNRVLNFTGTDADARDRWGLRGGGPARFMPKSTIMIHSLLTVVEKSLLK